MSDRAQEWIATATEDYRAGEYEAAQAAATIAHTISVDFMHEYIRYRDAEHVERLTAWRADDTRKDEERRDFDAALVERQLQGAVEGSRAAQDYAQELQKRRESEWEAEFKSARDAKDEVQS